MEDPTEETKRPVGRPPGRLNNATLQRLHDAQEQEQTKNAMANIFGDMPYTFTPAFIQWLGDFWMRSSFLQDWKSLRPHERFSLYERLYQYCQARKTATTDIVATTTAEDDLLSLIADLEKEGTHCP